MYQLHRRPAGGILCGPNDNRSPFRSFDSGLKMSTSMLDAAAVQQEDGGVREG